MNTHTTAPGVLLGLTGRAGAGKDTCAQLLHEHGFASIAFADALRAEVAEAWRIDPRMLADRDTKEWAIPALALTNCTDWRFVHALIGASGALSPEDMTAPRSPRWVMQRWGTEYRRRQNTLYWTDIVARWVGQQREQALQAHRPALLCITDVRFLNEASLVRALGGHVVQVHRPDLPELPTDTREHESEAPIITQVAVHNDGNLEHLRAELARVLDTLLKPRRAVAW